VRKKSGAELRVPAVATSQCGRALYCFVVDGKRVHDFAAVSRVRRSGGEIRGYQRPEVLAHVAGIRRYLEGGGPLLPGALVVAFDDSVRFEPAGGAAHSSGLLGTLVIPLRNVEDKPGFLVDGQQRAAALREARVGAFPVCVVGFVARDEAEQRQQFILVNSAKPLPRSLVYELLPVAGYELPVALARRKLPSLIAQRLNSDEDSPFRGLVSMPTNPDGVIQDNTVMRMVEHSLTDGALYAFRDRGTGAFDLEGALALLKDFWGAVARAFPEAWGKKPRLSRLSHGAGVAALGFIMDTSCERHRDEGVPGHRTFLNELLKIHPHCRWTGGEWDFGMGRVRRWNELQNVGRDARMLTRHLIDLYKDLFWPRREQGPREDPGGPAQVRAS
jgi:DGQHR domain-containing protein